MRTSKSVNAAMVRNGFTRAGGVLALALTLSVAAMEVGASSNRALSTGVAPINVTSGAGYAEDPMGGKRAGTVMYGVNYTAEASQYVSVDITAPGALTNIAVYAGANFPNACEFKYGSSEIMYDIDMGGGVREVNVRAGAVTNLGTTISEVTGMAVDSVSGKYYICTANTLYTWDPVTLVATAVGGFTTTTWMIGITCDGEGNLWGYDIETDQFYSINKTTGAATVIGSIGFDANYGQGLGYDPATDQIVMSAYNSTQSQAQLRIVDRTTGNSVLVGALGPDGAQMGSICAPMSVASTYTVTFEATTGGALSGETTQTVQSGADCSPVTAIRACGYSFVNWTGDLTSAENPLMVRNVTRNMLIIANFALKPNPEYWVATGSVFTVYAADIDKTAFAKTPKVQSVNLTTDKKGGKGKVLGFKKNAVSAKCVWMGKDKPETYGLLVDDVLMTEEFIVMNPNDFPADLSPDTGVAGDKITVTGKYFGSKCPKVVMEFKDAKGKLKKVTCKVMKPYAYTDAKGKLNNSIMDVNNGASKLVFVVPKGVTAATPVTVKITCGSDIVQLQFNAP